MLIQFQPKDLAILELNLELLAVEVRIVLVDDTGHSVVQQRPVHSFLHKKSAFVVHQLLAYFIKLSVTSHTSRKNTKYYSIISIKYNLSSVFY